MQRSCSGHLLVFPCDSGVRLWDAEIQAKVDYCYVWRREETRRVHFPRTWNQTGKPVLTDYCTAAKTRAAAHHVIFSSTKHPSPARLPSAAAGAAACTLVCYAGRKAAGWVRCSCWSPGQNPRRQTATCGLAEDEHGDCVCASWLYS